MSEILQKLYDSEINFSISTFWDGGFDVALGLQNDQYGSKFDDQTTVRTIQAAVDWLKLKACEHYPDSEFAREFK